MLQKYLHRRNNSYHFRWRIPADLRPLLSKTELTRSMHTLDLLEANRRASLLFEVVLAIKRARWSYLAKELGIDEYRLELQRCWGKLCPMSRNKRVIRTDYMMHAGVKFDYGSDEKDAMALKKAVDMGIVPDPKGSATETEPAEPQTEQSGMLFSELFDKFIKHKINPVAAREEGRNPLSDRMLKQYQSDFKVLLELMGDVDVTSITKKQLKQSILACTGLPKRNKKPYNKLSIAEILEMDIPDEDLVGKKVVDEIRKMVQGIFRFASDESIVDISPAKDLNLKLTSKGRFAAYTKQEVRSLLKASSKEKVAWRRWVPLLAAYTGARRGELVQLRKQDVKFDTDSERYYLMITEEAGSTKNENANRRVPIHQAVLDAGFIKFVESSSDKLFDGLKPQSVTNWFTGLRDELDIERFDDYGNSKVFHSFRHTFITLSRSVNHKEHVQQVVGHEKQSAGQTDRYTHSALMQLSEVLCVVDKISYEQNITS